MVGLIATKEGMTRIFHESVESIPVSVLKVDSNFVSQIKNSENDGYSAIQLSSLDKKEKNTSKKVGRNEKCPCGSGKKYKHCHGNI